MIDSHPAACGAECLVDDLTDQGSKLPTIELTSRELGTVQVGKRANLLLTRQDPTQSIQAYGDIVKVILHGRVLDRTELAAHR
jgi:hypothetical protein